MSAGAQALLRTVAGDAVTMRFAVPFAGGDGEELGLASPEFREVVLRPVFVRRQGERTTVLVDAATAETALGTADVKPALLLAVAAVVCGEVFGIAETERHAVSGKAYLYRLLLAAPAGRER